MQARRAHSAGIERVPGVPAMTEPAVIGARRPTAARTANPWAGGAGSCVLAGFRFDLGVDDRARSGGARRQHGHEYPL